MQASSVLRYHRFPFEILERICRGFRNVWLLPDPPQLSPVHDVFHVSLLSDYHNIQFMSHLYPFDQIQAYMPLSLREPDIHSGSQERVMRNKVIPL
ncbi:hypothetical protein Tco_0273885 [Tanacetum coccineum]